MAYFLACGVAAIALILAPGISFSFDTVPKLAILLLTAALASFPRRRSRILYLVLLTALSLTVSTALSAEPWLSFYGSGWRRFGALAQGAVLLVAWSIYGQARRAAVFLRIVTLAGAVTAVYGIAQYLGWDPILPKSLYHIGEGVWTIVRPPSTLGYASYFATWLVFVIFWSLALSDKFANVIFLLAAAALVLTGTRAAFLGLLVGGLVWTYWRGSRPSRRTLAAGLLVLVAAAAFYFSPLGLEMRSRTRWFREDPWGGARLWLWRDSFRAGLARPVAGYGPETFTATFPRFESKELARAYPDFAYESPHNIFLDALVSEGLPGLILLVAWCALGFTAAWRIRTKHPAISAGLAAALAGGIVSQQFTVFVIPTAMMFFATIALAEGLRSEAAPPRRYNPLAVPLLYFAARLAGDDHALLLTGRALAPGDLATASQEYESSHQADDLWYSRELASLAGKAPHAGLRVQAIREALTVGERATLTAEAPFNAWYSLSVLRASQNDAPGVEFCLRSAIAASPYWFKPHWVLAQILWAEGRNSEALSEARIAADLDAGKHPEVGRTLQEINLP